MTEGRAMRRFAVIWPLAILFGMLSIIAWDALSRARDHVIARDPSPAARGTVSRGSLASQRRGVDGVTFKIERTRDHSGLILLIVQPYRQES